MAKHWELTGLGKQQGDSQNRTTELLCVLNMRWVLPPNRKRFFQGFYSLVREGPTTVFKVGRGSQFLIFNIFSPTRGPSKHILFCFDFCVGRSCHVNRAMVI